MERVSNDTIYVEMNTLNYFHRLYELSILKFNNYSNVIY